MLVGGLGMDFAFLIVGLVVGFAVGWLWFRGRSSGGEDAADLRERLSGADGIAQELRRQVAEERTEAARVRVELERAQQGRVAAETRLAEAGRGFEEQRRVLQEAETKLREAFKALSADALKANTEQFTRQAEEKLRPLKEVLEKYEQQVVAMEKAREGAYAGVRQLLESIGSATQHLQKETGKLVTALRAPQVRGRWGEITLQRVVEAAGMSQHCDFATQVSAEADGGLVRPDLVVYLPGDRTIVVDAKTPLNHYLEACEAADEEARANGLQRHARAVRGHMESLSSKSYWRHLDPTPDFVVMFLPGESFFSAALEQDRGLIEAGIGGRVILATPTTLIALLKTVAYAWQQRDVSANAERIAHTARELFERISTFAGGHLAEVGKGLRSAVKAYNEAARSWESRVAPAGRRVAELGATPKDAVFPELAAVETSPGAGAADLATAGEGGI